MLIARLEQAGLSYGTRIIFEQLSLSLNDGEKIGLIGQNGTGKSSLLKVLAGVEGLNKGERILRKGVKVAYLPQEFNGEDQTSALEEVLKGKPEIQALEQALEKIEAELAKPENAADMQHFGELLERQAELLEKHEEIGGPRLLNEARGFLEQLGLPADMHQYPVSLLSGGQRKMVGLARCLVSQPDLLLLDEPDNHLDLEGKARLEEVIQDFPGALILISHDRYLLDDTIEEIAELENGVLTLYQGNYSSYTVQRELTLLKQQQDYVSQQKEIKQLEEAITRFKLWASIVVNERHIKQARNKQRQIDRMDKIERPVLERRKIGLKFKSAERGGQKVLEARHLAKAFDDNLVLLDVDFTLRRGERVGLVGKNGTGKSVLFRLLLGLQEATEGEIWVGPSIRLGYYSQQHETLDQSITPLQLIRNLRPLRENEAISVLGRFLFTFRQAQEPISKLSGGEKSRLQLASLMLSGVNCLLLDEPTNHLDITSTEVLEEALNNFDGTMLTISHDRYFLDRSCSRILELEEGMVLDYPGGYSYYTEQKRKIIQPSITAKR
ncbi:MAG: ABC-F family ATP-binding cassette domain-containing protein [Chloroflexi bacterium]|uniref:ATP-binding cassette domain-containing protein n=1 Tax=Candidatus Chlorohelix allophototropha TaxID=3003348 RepID=A0A8T7LXY5_9CHLR|nr:ABC-F family ATP-binding cassette domain-containing protein [Chloroflexota bacterium]WJW67708.1 ATP-binding cassette domain-containing protein [Chloroflexota bacterium L227-S17]